MFGLALALAFTPVVAPEAAAVHLLLRGGIAAWILTALHAYALLWLWGFFLGRARTRTASVRGQRTSRSSRIASPSPATTRTPSSSVSSPRRRHERRAAPAASVAAWVFSPGSTSPGWDATPSSPGRPPAGHGSLDH
jgi:hypothetical protein